MAVTAYKELWKGRGGDADAKGVRRYTRIFRVYTNSKTDDVATVGAGFTTLSGIGYGSAHPEDASAYLQSLRPQNEDFSPKHWLVTLGYSNERETAALPQNEPAIITWDTDQFQRPAIYDTNGDAILNSAGDYFDPPVMRDDSRCTATIQKNLTAVPSYILTYRDAINNASFTLDGILIAKWCAKIQRISVGKVETRSGVNFRQVTIVMHFREEDWRIRVLDQGYHETGDLVFSGDNDGRYKILNDDGTEPTQPVLLDGNGKRLANPSPTNAVFLTKEVYTEKNFAILPLT